MARTDALGVKSAIGDYELSHGKRLRTALLEPESRHRRLSDKIKFAVVVDLITLAKNRERIMDSSCRKVMVMDSGYKLELCNVPILDKDHGPLTRDAFADWMNEENEELELPDKADVIQALNTNNHIMNCLENLGNSVTKLTLILTMACHSNAAKNKVKRKFVDWMLSSKTSTKRLMDDLAEIMQLDLADGVFSYLDTDEGKTLKKAAASFGRALRAKKDDALTRYIETSDEGGGLSKFDMRYIRSQYSNK